MVTVYNKKDVFIYIEEDATVYITCELLKSTQLFNARIASKPNSPI